MNLRVLALLVVLGLMTSACVEQRTNLRTLPDRKGHAFVRHGPTGAAPTASTAQPAVLQDAPDMPPGVVGRDEQLHMVQSGERIYQIAERYGVDAWWVIDRNHITVRPQPGNHLIVPRR